MVLPAGGQNLGQATARIVLDTSGIEAGVTRAQTLLSNAATSIGGSITSIGNRMSGIGAQLSLVTGPLALVGGVGLRAAGDFDAAMSMISARTGLVGEDLEAVRLAAMEMGADTMFSSQQAADGFLQLLTAGLSAEEALETLPAVLNGAAAAGENLGTTADLVTNVMSSFRLEAEDATAIVQTMSAAAASSPASMTEMGQALQSVGGIASTLGLGLDQTSSVLAIFAQNGIRGAEAGTQLRSMLRQMTSDTESVQGAWSELGVSLFDNQGNMRDINTVMQELDGALNQLPIEDQNRLMQDLAGSYGIVGFSALRAGVSIGDMMTTMGEQASFMDIAQEQMNTFKGLTTSLAGSIETAMITAFTPFMNNVLKPMVEQQIKIVNGITAWMRENQGLTQTIVTVISKLITLGPVLFAAGKALSIIGVMVTKFGRLIAFLSSPLGWVTLAVIAFVAAWRSNFLGLRDFLEPVVNRISNAFGLLRQGINHTISMFRSSGDALASIRMGLTLWISEILMVLGVSEDFAQGVERAIFNMVGRLQGIFRIAGGILDAFAFVIQNVFFQIGQGRNIFDAMVVSIALLIRMLGSTLGLSTQLTDRLIIGFMSLANGTENTFGRISTSVGVFVSRFSAGFRRIGYLISAFIADLQQFGLEEAFRGIFGTGAITDNMESTLEGVLVAFGVNRDQAIQIVGSLWAFLENTFNGIRNTINRVATAIRPMFREVFTFLGNLLENINFEQVIRVGQVLLGLTNPLGIVMNLLRLFRVDILSIFEDVVAGVTSFFASLNSGENLSGAIGSVFGDDVGAGAGGAISGIQGFLQGLVSFVTDTVIPGLDALRVWFVEDALPAVISFIETTVIPTIGNFFTFLGNAWAVIGPTLNMIATWFIQDMMPAIITFITSAVIPAFQALFSFIGSAWAVIGPALGQLATWFLQDALPVILEFISGTAMPAITTFIQILTDIWTAVSPFLLQLLDFFITTGLPLAVTFFEEVLIPIVQNFIDLLVGIWDAVQPGLDLLWGGIQEIFGFIQGVIQDVINILSSPEGQAGFLSVINHVASAILQPLNAIQDAFSTVFGFIDTFVIQPVITLIESIVGIAEDVASRVGGVIGPIGDVMGGVGGFIQDPLGAAGDFIGSIDLNPFSQGGYTGDAPVNQPTGIVHGQEYVVPKDGALVLERNGDQGGGDIIINVNLPEGINPDNAEETGQLVGGSISEELRRRGLLANGA